MLNIQAIIFPAQTCLQVVHPFSLTLILLGISSVTAVSGSRHCCSCRGWGSFSSAGCCLWVLLICWPQLQCGASAFAFWTGFFSRPCPCSLSQGLFGPFAYSPFLGSLNIGDFSEDGVAPSPLKVPF